MIVTDEEFNSDIDVGRSITENPHPIHRTFSHRFSQHKTVTFVIKCDENFQYLICGSVIVLFRKIGCNYDVISTDQTLKVFISFRFSWLLIDAHIGKILSQNAVKPKAVITVSKFFILSFSPSLSHTPSFLSQALREQSYLPPVRPISSSWIMVRNSLYQ